MFLEHYQSLNQEKRYIYTGSIRMFVCGESIVKNGETPLLILCIPVNWFSFINLTESTICENSEGLPVHKSSTTIGSPWFQLGVQY